METQKYTPEVTFAAAAAQIRELVASKATPVEIHTHIAELFNAAAIQQMPDFDPIAYDTFFCDLPLPNIPSVSQLNLDPFDQTVFTR